jgi:hypothetical protein
MLPFHCFLSDAAAVQMQQQFSFKLVAVMNDDAASGQGLLVRKSASQPVMPSDYLCGARAAAMKEAAGVGPIIT